MRHRFRTALGYHREAQASTSVGLRFGAAQAESLQQVTEPRPSSMQTAGTHTHAVSFPRVQPDQLLRPPITDSDKARENAALQDAIERYSATIPKTERDFFKEAATKITEENLLEGIKTYDESHQKRSTYRARAPTVSKFLGLLNTFMRGVAIGIQSTPEISSLVVGGVRIVLDIAIKFVTFFESLTEMLCLFSHYIEVLLEYAKAADFSLVRKAIAILYEDLLRFCFAAQKVFIDSSGQARRWTSIRVFIRVQWEPFQETFGKIKIDFNEHLGLLRHSAGAVQLNLLQDVSRKAEADRNLVERKRLVEERKNFLLWLSKLDFEATHSILYSKKHPGTGDWLTQNEKFQSWFLGDTSQLLWCYGKAGVGKSVLCSNILEYIASCHGTNPDVGIVFAYCKWDYPETQKPAQIIAAFMKELCCKLDPIPPNLLKIFHSWDKNNKSLSMSWDRSQSKELFLEVGCKFRQIFIVIDALDECSLDNRREILSFVLEICSSFSSIKVFLTSRLEKDLASICERSKVPSIRIGSDNVSADIRSYVTDQTQQLIVEDRLVLQDPYLRDTIIQALTERAEGMFLWVNLQLSRLCQATKDRHIISMLETLPRGLDGTYTRILNQIGQQEEPLIQLALKSITWVLYAKTPLTAERLQNAVSMDPSITSIKQLDLESMRNIFAACANIIVEDQGHISLVHFSAQEFLTKKTRAFDEDGLLSIISNGNLAHSTMAKTCIIYLCLSLREDEPWASYWSLRDFFRAYPLCWYAAHFFDYHALSSSPIPEDLLTCLDNLFNEKPPVIDAIIRLRALGFDGLPRSTFYSQAKFSLRLGSLFTYTTLADVPELVARWPDHQTSLHEAVIAKNIRTINWLVSHKHDVNEQDAAGRTPLFIAAAAGNVDICEALLSNGALVLKNKADDDNALHAATRFGHFAVVKLLLEYKCDPNIRGGLLCFPLQAAACHNQKLNDEFDLVALLLKHNAVVNAQGGPFGTALQAAAYNGSLKAVETLLKNGADVNLRGGLYPTALEAAVSCALTGINGGFSNDTYAFQFLKALETGEGDHLPPVSEFKDAINNHLKKSYGAVIRALLLKNPDEQSRRGAAHAARNLKIDDDDD